MKSSIWKRQISRDGRWRMIFTSLIFPISAALIALLIAAVLVAFSTYGWAIVIGTLIIVIVTILRQDELAVAIVAAVHLYVDWYLGARVAALVIALLLLGIFYLARSPQHPWVGLRFFWLWLLLLAFAFFPAMNGLTLPDGFTYYLDIMFGAMLTFWLGTIVVQRVVSLRRFLSIFSLLGALIAVHTLIQQATGILLFGSSRYDAFLAIKNNLVLSGTDASRVGSFFVDPNWNGTFLVMLLFLPLAIYFESKSLITKALCLVATFLMLIAVLSTFSNGAWVGSFAGLLIFVVLVGRIRYSVQILLITFIIAAMMIILLPTQISLQIQHASGAQELSSRVAAWNTAIKVIYAFPWTGIGLGTFAYLARADPFRDPLQSLPLAQPHNSYLELGAMAGLPVLAIFMALLILAIYRALRNWTLSDRQTRALYAGGIASVVALSINSVSINGWTLAPIATVGWLILGAISSSVVKKQQQFNDAKESQWNT